MEESVIAALLFWSGAAFILYTYFGYPVLLSLLGRWRRRSVTKDIAFTPFVSLLIVAHNEEKVIRRKLENALALDYPRDRIEILVASDGSLDRTNDIVREFQERGVILLAFPIRRGKPQTLNDAVPKCRGEIVVFSDARQEYDRRAVRELVSNFGEPTIGAVTGDLQFRPGQGDKGGDEVGLYWKYEKWIRRCQSQVDSISAVTGAIYAIRKSLFRPLPSGAIADDLVVPLSIVMQGYRVIYDATAKAYDHFQLTMREEFRKRVRTIAGSYQYLFLVPRALHPTSNRIWVHFLSHKAFRVLAPFVLLVMLGANLALTAWPYRIMLALQVAFYGVAAAGTVITSRTGLFKAFSGPSTFLLLNAAACVAFFKVVSGVQTHLWEKRDLGVAFETGTDRAKTNKGASTGAAGV